MLITINPLAPYVTYVLTKYKLQATNLCNYSND